MSIVESSENKEREFVDLNLAPIRKRKIRIDGDQNRILELDTTDIGVAMRLSEFYPKLEELQKQFNELEVKYDEEGNMTDESFDDMGKAIKEIDTKMRQYMDEIFNGNVSEMCAPSGNMFDPINGSFRFEYIIDALSKLYEDEIARNLEERKENISKHTAKYKGKRKK